MDTQTQTEIVLETARDIWDATEELIGALDVSGDDDIAKAKVKALEALEKIISEAQGLREDLGQEPDAEPDAHNPVISRGYPRSVAGYQQMAGIGGGR